MLQKTVKSIGESILCMMIMLVSCLSFAGAINTTTVIAQPTNNPIYCNNQRIDTLPVYSINDANYFKLRDIGYLMDFGVSWNSEKSCVEINTMQSSDGEQVSKQKATQNKVATLSNQPIYIDGNLQTDLTAYLIDGNNFFKLRDLASAVDFGCVYDSSTNSVVLDNRYHYAPNDKFVNLKSETNYSYYVEYPLVPDFGSVVDATLRYNSGKDENGVIYYYNSDFDVSKISKYKTELQKNGFNFLLSYPLSDGEIDVYTGNDLDIQIGFDGEFYTVFICDSMESDETSYQYYLEHSTVLDFGAFTGATLYTKEHREGEGTIYTYGSDFTEDKLDEYKNWLTSNGYYYMGYNSQASAYIYIGADYTIFINYVPNTDNHFFMLGVFEQ